MNIVVLFTLFLASFTFASTDPNVVEGKLEAPTTAPKVNPLNVSVKSTFKTNVHGVWSFFSRGTEIPDQNIFLNEISMDKKFNVGKFAGFNVTTTPKASAAFFLGGDLPESDTLKSGSIGNKLSLATQKGNLSYGMNLDASYNTGYTIRMRDRNGDNAEEAYKRDNTNTKIQADIFASILIDPQYKLSGEAKVIRYNNSSNYYPDFRNIPAPNFANMSTKEADHTRYSAAITNQFIASKNVSFEIPLEFQVRDYDTLNAFTTGWGASPDGVTSLRYIYGGGLKGTFKMGMFTLKGGFEIGRYDEQRVSNSALRGEILTVESSLSTAITDKITFDLSYALETDDWAQDAEYVGDEKYDTYGATLTIENPFNAPMTATMGYEIENGGWASRFSAKSASLNLAFKL